MNRPHFFPSRKIYWWCMKSVRSAGHTPNMIKFNFVHYKLLCTYKMGEIDCLECGIFPLKFSDYCTKYINHNKSPRQWDIIHFFSCPLFIVLRHRWQQYKKSHAIPCSIFITFLVFWLCLWLLCFDHTINSAYGFIFTEWKELKRFNWAYNLDGIIVTLKYFQWWNYKKYFFSLVSVYSSIFSKWKTACIQIHLKSQW